MNIYYGVLFGESAYPAENCITSCWNIKTGERIEKFTDLFYKDSDFVPALNRAFGMYFDEIGFVFTGEPKNFNITTLTDLTDTKPRYRETYGDDEKEKPMNAFGEIYKEMPDGYLENKNTVYAAGAVDYPDYEYVSEDGIGQGSGVYLPSVLETVGLHNVIYPDVFPE
jgi:hypothetical protein